jgi:hypothetical protein
MAHTHCHHVQFMSVLLDCALSAAVDLLLWMYWVAYLCSYLVLLFVQVHDFPMLVNDGGQLLQAELMVGNAESDLQLHSFRRCAVAP